MPQEDSVGEEDRRRRRKPEATAKPPSLDEWQDFLGLTVLRMLTEGYLQLVLFRQVDESELTERERELIRLTKDDLRDMAAPMASLANKNKFARKHGRQMIAAADSYEALIDLFIWMRRVNKIARRHKPTTLVEETVVEGRVVNDGPVSGQNGTANSRADRSGGSGSTGFSIFNRGTG